MRLWAGFLLTLIVGSCLGAPPSPTGTKRSDENIQFGNQQNKPVSVLDEDALPGAFPSSETTETGYPETPTANPANEEEDEDEEAHINKDEDEDEPQEEPPSPPSSLEEHRHLEPVSQHLNHLHQPPLHREEMIRDLPPVALASRWRSPSQFYSITDWAMPISPMYGGGGGGDDGSFPSRRRRRSAEHTAPTPDPKKILQVSLHALRTGHRHKREIPEVRRIRRDLSNIDLEKLRREVDIVELLSMLARPAPHRNPGFATVTYAPLAPAPPRFAPQPKLFPDYDDEEEEEEDEDERVGFQRQSLRQPPPPPPPQQQPEPVMFPAGGRVWRRSGGYGLSTVPGFKRSSFRANTPAPPMRPLNPGDVYSLAAMLGAELDPATHRLRRAAM